ncbi:MAG: hypothetical protein IV085_07940 [Thiobacillus sp.]|nr:hypothetical protein [Thiobacillus sp.]
MATNSVRTKTIFLALFTLATLSVRSVQCCDLNEIKKNAKNVSDVVCDKGVGRIYLKYDPVQRKIWLEGANKKINQTVLRLDKNANPELVGAEGSIRFVPNQIVKQGEADYIGLIVAERSTRGSGGGQCGAGSEEYFVAYKLTGTMLKEMHRSLIHSCIKGMDLDTGDGNNNDFSVRFDGEAIVFKWLTYPGTDAQVAGHYYFSTNQLETRKNE